MGATYAMQFLQKCKPRDYDYTAERHKWLADDPDILTMAKQIQTEKTLRAKEESVKTERIAAWRSGLLELTDIEIYELGFKVLADNLGAYGLLRFITQHFKNLNAAQPIDQPQRALIENLRFSVDPSTFSDFKDRVSMSGKLENSCASMAS